MLTSLEIKSGQTEPEAESHVSSVLRHLNEIVDEARRDWIPPAQDDVVFSHEPKVGESTEWASGERCQKFVQ